MQTSPLKPKPIVRYFRLPLPAMIVFVFALVFNANALADNALRCNGAIVSLGATTREVLDKCGRPNQRESWQTAHNQYVRQFYDYEKERFILPELIVGPIQMERWTYDFGSNRFIRYLHFLNGELIKIETGDKGSN
jgi:hypothetical protein